MSKYQVMEEYYDTPAFEALMESIKDVGVLVAIEISAEDGSCLDGHHRLEACRRLGIKDYPVVYRAGIGDDIAKRTYARTINAVRRTLTTAQKQRIIKEQLADTPEYSDRRIAEMLSVSNKTVGSIRKQLFDTSEEITQSKRVGRDGINRPATNVGAKYMQKPVTVFNPTSTEKSYLKDEKVVEIMRDTSSKSPAVAMRRINLAKKYSVQNSEISLTAKDYKVFVGDIMNGLPEIPDKSVDLLFVDPYYAKEYLPLLSKISEIAERVLTDDGNLLLLYGNHHAKEAIILLTEFMELHWTLCWLTPNKAPVGFNGVSTRWKPLYWLRKEGFPYKAKGDNQIIHDVITVPPDDGDKVFHPHGQSPESCMEVIKQFTKPGDTILDLCCGGGSSGVAAAVLNRRYIGVDLIAEYVKITQQRILEVLNNG